MKANNGNGHTVIDKELITDVESLEAVTAKTSPSPEAAVDTPEALKAPQPETDKKAENKRKKLIGLILAGVGVGAIDQAEASLKDAQLQLSYHQITPSVTLPKSFNVSQ